MTKPRAIHPAKTAVGQRLRKARLAAKLTMRQVADLVKRTVPAVSSWETGRTSPSFEMLTELAKHLDTSISWLMNGDEPGYGDMLVNGLKGIGPDYPVTGGLGVDGYNRLLFAMCHNPIALDNFLKELVKQAAAPTSDRKTTNTSAAGHGARARIGRKV